MNELERAIKKYRLDELLILIANQSRELFVNSMPVKEVEWRRFFGGVLQVFKQVLPIWHLADLSYLAIKNSNDYRSIIPTLDDLYKLNNLLIKMSDEKGRIRREDLSKEDIKTHILFGYSQKQFWYQEIIMTMNIYYNFLRYYILLNEIPLLLPKHKLPNEDLLEITGFSINEFSQLLMAGYSYNYANSSSIRLIISEELKDKLPILTEENLKRCLNSFIGDYKFYRESNIPNNPLYLKPIVRTDRNKLIISNAFIWARTFYEGIYWIIRNKYMKAGSQEFINRFGEYYERYIEEVLKHYLNPHQYKKLDGEGIKKKADWLIEAEKYILVVEQKSSLMTIALKEEYPSLETLDEYLTKTFKDAYVQIAETAKAIGESNKRIIKLILHFEKFFLGEGIIKDRIKQIFKKEFDNLSDYFFIETEEFEKLIQLLSVDEEAFNKIIETKLSYELNLPPGEGLEFNFIINKLVSITKIEFLENRKHYFESLMRTE